MVDSDHAIRGVAVAIGHAFTLHDLRRTFLTTAEMLEVPHYALKRLANHVATKDVTSGYVVVSVERMRIYMARLSEHFCAATGAAISDLRQSGERNL
jgi:hypothetical protein